MSLNADFDIIIKPKTAKAVDKSEITSEHEACGFGYLFLNKLRLKPDCLATETSGAFLRHFIEYAFLVGSEATQPCMGPR